VTRRLLRSLAVVGSLLTSAGLSACGVAGGAHDRAVVEARTCIALLERAGRPADGIDLDDFVAALRRFEDGTGPYSTLQPFLRACPLRG
jgi:hypothetical protein